MTHDPEVELFKKLLGELVARYRKKAKLSQERLGFEVNCSTNNIQDIEAGRYCCTAFKMFKLARVLGIPLSELEAIMNITDRVEEVNV